MREADCYPGKRVGRLTLIEKRQVTNGNGTTSGGWLCKCDCGTEKVIRTSCLGRQKSSATLSCGCLGRENVKKSSKHNYQSGDRVGRLTLIRKEFEDRGSYKRTVWYCKCDCGNETKVDLCHLYRDTRSCGCLNLERISQMNAKYKDKDASKGTPYYPIYGKWKAMLRRCENPKCAGYPEYGGRGISVCDKWHDYLTFRSWCLDNGFDTSVPNAGSIFTLDRIDVNGNYEPNNCRFLTNKEQQFNKRNNILIDYKGNKHTIEYIANDLGYNWDVIYHRWRQGDRGEKLIRPVKRELDYNHIYFQGKRWTVKEIAEFTHISPDAVRERFRKGDRGDRLFRMNQNIKGKEKKERVCQ